MYIHVYTCTYTYILIRTEDVSECYAGLKGDCPRAMHVHEGLRDFEWGLGLYHCKVTSRSTEAGGIVSVWKSPLPVVYTSRQCSKLVHWIRRKPSYACVQCCLLPICLRVSSSQGHTPGSTQEDQDKATGPEVCGISGPRKDTLGAQRHGPTFLEELQHVP